jgi:two-component system sensor histidine kinase YesM
VYKRIKKWYLNVKIRNKIFILCGIFIVISLAVNMTLYTNVLYKTAVSQMNEASRKTLFSTKDALEAKISGINHASRLVMNSNVLDIIVKSEGSYESVAALDRLIRPVIDTFPFIHSVCIYGLDGFKYSLFKNTDYLFPVTDIQSAEWYDEVMERNGYYILRYNAGGFYGDSHEGRNYISMIRSINSTSTQKHIGVLVINVGTEYFLNGMNSAMNSGEAFSLFSENGKEMMNYGDDVGMGINLPDFLEDLKNSPSGSHFATKSIDNNEYLVSGLYLAEHSWSILTVNSLSSVLAVFNWLNMLTMSIFIISTTVIGTGIFIMSRAITRPIEDLISSMKGVRNREFNKVFSEPDRTDEIGQLKHNYNIMIDEIQNLIARVIDEQRIKRTAELNVLHEQIKPHFLCNIIDTICYFALTGKNDDVYNSLETLGCYFRNVLSKGCEEIPLKTEISIIKDYLALQRLRYGNVFDEVFDIDESLLNYPVLKLTIQPFVENALYHGVRQKDGGGVIRVSVRKENGCIVIIVADNGAGIEASRLKEILSSGRDSEKIGFGLAGTLERIKMYYSIDNFYSITSNKDVGTIIEIRIPFDAGSVLV